MNFRAMLLALVAASLATIPAVNSASASSQWRDPDQSRQATRDMVDQTLERLYRLEPSARQAVSQAGFYAVFDVGPSGSGPGMVVEDSIREETLMGVQGSVPASPGGYRQVWLFRTPKAYRLFVAHGHAFADGTRLEPHLQRNKQWPPGALAVNHDITLYHLTDAGLQRDVTMPASAYRRNAAFDRGWQD